MRVRSAIFLCRIMHEDGQELIISDRMESQQGIDKKIYVGLPVEDLNQLVSCSSKPQRVLSWQSNDLNTAMTDIHVQCFNLCLCQMSSWRLTSQYLGGACGTN